MTKDNKMFAIYALTSEDKRIKKQQPQFAAGKRLSLYPAGY
jgi:hypothetical protein